MAEKISGIYKIINTINNKIYIGKSIDIHRRWISHISSLNNNNHHSIYLQRSWNKYGCDNFKFEIIESCSLDELNFIEDKYLTTYKSYDRINGYNIDSESKTISNESRAKMSLSHKKPENIKITLQNSKISALKRQKKVCKYSLKGELICVYDSVTNAAEDNFVNIKSISSVCTRKTVTCNGFIFRYFGDNNILDRSNARRRPIISIDSYGNETEYESAIYASKVFNCDPSAINRCCRGLVKTSNNLMWRYK